MDQSAQLVVNALNQGVGWTIIRNNTLEDLTYSHPIKEVPECYNKNVKYEKGNTVFCNLRYSPKTLEDKPDFHSNFISEYNPIITWSQNWVFHHVLLNCKKIQPMLIRESMLDIISLIKTSNKLINEKIGTYLLWNKCKTSLCLFYEDDCIPKDLRVLCEQNNIIFNGGIPIYLSQYSKGWPLSKTFTFQNHDYYTQGGQGGELLFDSHKTNHPCICPCNFNRIEKRFHTIKINNEISGPSIQQYRILPHSNVVQSRNMNIPLKKSHIQSGFFIEFINYSGKTEPCCWVTLKINGVKIFCWSWYDSQIFENDNSWGYFKFDNDKTIFDSICYPNKTNNIINVMRADQNCSSITIDGVTPESVYVRLYTYEQNVFRSENGVQGHIIS
tara:strand:- start:702 stop:1859 length:1158 start_codon:yes stop_codon:yes gene_type:complete